MSSPREDLLRPSLAVDDAPAAAPFSVRTMVLTSFMGGPFAAAVIVGINSFRLRRLGRDAAIVIATLVVGLAAIWWLLQDPPTNRSLPRLYSRTAALLIAGTGYLLHRRDQRTTDMAGLERPNGFTAGIACVFAGSLLYAGFLLLVL